MIWSDCQRVILSNVDTWKTNVEMLKNHPAYLFLFLSHFIIILFFFLLFLSLSLSGFCAQLWILCTLVLIGVTGIIRTVVLTGIFPPALRQNPREYCIRKPLQTLLANAGV